MKFNRLGRTGLYVSEIAMGTWGFSGRNYFGGAIGTLTQKEATAFIGRVVMGDRGTASGIYLACYYLGGLVGSILLGVIFDTVGWGACLSGIAIALLIAVCLVTRLKPSSPRFAQSSPIQERTP